MTEKNSDQNNLFIEFTTGSAAIAVDGKISTIALEHDASGKLTRASRDSLKRAIEEIISNHAQCPANVYCAISARGVSLRRLTLPPTKAENLRQMLSFQIEKEFPIGPDELAWGFQTIHPGSAGEQPMEVLLVAVKKDLIADYSAILTELGLTANFTVGVISSAASLSDREESAFAVLHVGTSQTEVLLSENGVPSMVRTFPIGVSGEMSALADRLSRVALPYRVFLTGQLEQDAEQRKRIEETMRSSEQGGRLTFGESPSAIEAMRQMVSGGRADKLVALCTGWLEVVSTEQKKPFPAKWAAIAAVLLTGALVMRYVEPFTKKTALEAKIAEVNTARESLPPIEEELEFLRYLDKSRPAYLNAVTVLADSIPRGAKFENLNLTRQGDFTLRVTLKTQQEATLMREKLLESGLFSRVVLEEQTPSEQRGNRGLNTRISARWIPDPKTPSKTIDRIVKESSTEKEKG